MRLSLMRAIPIVITFLLFSSGLSAQYMESRLGFRSGYVSGITFSKTIEQGNGASIYQGILGFKERGLQLTALKLRQEYSLDEVSPNLMFSYGLGGHAGFVYTNELRFLGRDYQFGRDRFLPLIGVDGYVGIDYYFQGYPVIVSLNCKPFLELYLPGFFKIIPVDIGLTVEYLF